MPFLNGSAQWMAIAFSGDCLIRTVSSTVEQITGYSPDELILKPLACIIAGAGRPGFTEALHAANEWGMWNGELLHQDREGRQLPAQAMMTSLAGRGNETAGFLLISALDIPGAEDPAEIPLAAVSAHLRAIAHEINNPLAVIMGLTQLNLLDTRCDPRVHEDMEKIYHELGRVIRLVEKFHSYAISLSHPRADLEPAHR